MSRSPIFKRSFLRPFFLVLFLLATLILVSCESTNLSIQSHGPTVDLTGGRGFENDNVIIYTDSIYAVADTITASLSGKLTLANAEEIRYINVHLVTENSSQSVALYENGKFRFKNLFATHYTIRIKRKESLLFEGSINLGTGHMRTISGVIK